ncbi:MAG: response regulator, partial [Desulfovibrionaceae bacterium]|nr:response regulator [Desulfovibrionaceae bacterium]
MDLANELNLEQFVTILQQFREPAVLLRQNQDGTYKTIFVTEQFAALLEATVEDATKCISESGYLLSTHAEERIFVRRMLRRHVNEEGGSNLILRIVTTKGNERYCDIHYSFFNLDSDLYIYCTYADISLLKQYEQRLSNAYTNLNDNFYKIVDTTLGLFRVNLNRDVIEEMKGKELFNTDSLVTPYSAVLLKRSEKCIIPHERDLFLESFDPEELLVGYLKGRSQICQIYYSRRPDGSARYVKMCAITTRHPMNGDIIAFISEEEANQTKVKETLLDRILVRQFDMVAWLSENQYGVVIGDASMVGRGSIFPKTRFGNYEEYLLDQVKPVINGSESERQEVFQALSLETVAKELVQKSPYIVNISISIDSEIWYKRFVFYLIDPQANFYIVLKGDTTDLQREQMRVNSQLKLALSEAKQANVAKTAFLSRMSHEIRTPMNAIIGLSTLATHEPNLSENLKDYLSKIEGSAKYLLSLINDILDMSRIESGRMVIKNEPFSFKNFLDFINTKADAESSKRGLKYECLINGSISNYYIGDEVKLRQVLSNLLSNALKFTPKGGQVSLKIEANPTFEGQAILKFSIKDTGIGINQDYLPKIFEPFSQEDSSNTSQYGGSGLGLAICKNIVALMHGEIKVESVKGEGSTFTVTVSLKESNQKDLGFQNLEVKNLKVLTIDDDLIAGQHAHLVLEEYGIKSRFCLSGSEALKILQEEPNNSYDVILVDLKMPTQDGLEVTRAIRNLLGQKPIIIITAYSWLEVEEKAYQAGVDGFLAK